MRINLSRACVAVCAIGLSLGAANARAEQPKDVNVVKTSANPVPVTLEGTSTISGSVTITNTPSVNVINGVTVRDADRPTNQPVHLAFSANTTSGSGFQFWQANGVYTVPAGKRLVVEDVDAEIIVTPASNTGSTRANLEIFSGSSFFSHAIGSTAQAVQCSLTQTCFSLSRATKIYLEPGSTLSFTASANLTQSGGFHVVRGTINGHLVDVP